MPAQILWVRNLGRAQRGWLASMVSGVLAGESPVLGVTQLVGSWTGLSCLFGSRLCGLCALSPAAAGVRRFWLPLNDGSGLQEQKPQQARQAPHGCPRLSLRGHTPSLLPYSICGNSCTSTKTGSPLKRKNVDEFAAMFQSDCNHGLVCIFSHQKKRTAEWIYSWISFPPSSFTFPRQKSVKRNIFKVLTPD